MKYTQKVLGLIGVIALVASMSTTAFAAVSTTATSSFDTDVNEIAVLAIAGTPGNLVLGATMSVAGLAISDTATISLNAAGGYSLTLGNSGIAVSNTIVTLSPSTPSR